MSEILNKKDANKLCDWYEHNKRELPWRDTGNAYDVWLSEIMLQQTRIEAVKEKFILFKKELPTIKKLAECDDDKLMRLWEGLGYYSRARNLKKCAIELVNNYHSKLPEEAEVLVKLPGIGPYTSGAISSIAFNKPAPAVDGNVLRVLTRISLDNRDVRDNAIKKEYEDKLQSLLNTYDVSSSSFNQGLMELGETICLPNGEPHCKECPFKTSCIAHKENKTAVIPYRSKLNERKIIERTLFIIRDGDQFLIHKRPSTGLLANLYEFIGINSTLSKKEIILLLEEKDIHPLKIKKLPDAKHIFTHLEWHMSAYEITVEEIQTLTSKEYFLFNKKQLSEKAIPSAFKKYVDYYTLRD